MSPERRKSPDTVKPIASLDDPRAITLLSTEHWSLLSARSLAYNEAFTRAGMFLTFLSMSFVALALVAQATSFERDFLAVAALVLAFDLVIGLATALRINGANVDDLRANHGMARIRHAYTRITPMVTPYFTTPIHDDMASVLKSYGTFPDRVPGQLLYLFTTSGGMIVLIVSMVGGVLAAVLTMLTGLDGGAPIWIGVAGGLVIIAALAAYAGVSIPREQARFTALFPAPTAVEAADHELEDNRG